MLLSIHDVPRYERHLLFCSTLQPQRTTRRRHRHSEVPAMNRALAIVGESVHAADLVPLAPGFSGPARVGVA